MERLFRHLSLAFAALAATLAGCRQVPSLPESSEADRLDSIYGSIYDPDVLQHLDDSLGSVRGGEAERIRVLKQKGKVLRNHSAFDEALEAHREGLALAVRLRDTVEVVRAYNNIGTDYRRMGALRDAAENHYAALKVNDDYSVRDIFATRKNRVTALNGLGNVYLSLGDYVLADSIFRQALATERELGSHLGQAINLANIGSIFESQGQMDSARAYYERSLAENELADSRLGIALCHINFGSLHEHDRNWQRAVGEYRQAYDILADGHDQWHWLQAAVALGKVYLASHDMAAARHYLDTAWTVAIDIGSVEHQAEVAHLRSDYYERLGDSRLALACLHEATALSDSVNSSQKMSSMSTTRLRYQEDRLRNEMRAMERVFDSERQAMTMTIVAIALALLLVVLLAAFLGFYIRVRARRQRLLIVTYERRLEAMKRVAATQTAQQVEQPAPRQAPQDVVGEDGRQAPPPAEAGSDVPASAELSPEEIPAAPLVDAGDYYEDGLELSEGGAATFLDDFNRAIRSHIDDPELGPAMLATMLNVSQRQLSRKVHLYTGLDTVTCIRVVRVSEAKHLLLHSDLSILDIAIRCGFDSASYFARVFRSEVGLSPSNYRKEKRNPNTEQ